MLDRPPRQRGTQHWPHETRVVGRSRSVCFRGSLRAEVGAGRKGRAIDVRARSSWGRHGYQFSWDAPTTITLTAMPQCPRAATAASSPTWESKFDRLGRRLLRLLDDLHPAHRRPAKHDRQLRPLGHGVLRCDIHRRRLTPETTERASSTHRRRAAGPIETSPVIADGPVASAQWPTA